MKFDSEKETIGFRVDAKQRAWIDAISLAKMVSISDYIRSLVENDMKEEMKKNA